jgi:DNA-binding NarL/FixJ family response regulator
MKKARILLAEDHKIVIEGLKNLLEPEFEIVGAVENGRALLTAAQDINHDVIVADISMPLLNRIDALRQIKKDNSETKVVFLSMHSDVTYATSALEAGASAYVLKHSASSELVAAIHEALKGRTFITPTLYRDRVMLYTKGNQNRNDTFAKITSRQIEVLQLLAEGKSIKEIAYILNISNRTVEFHKYRMMENLEIRTSAELVRYAIKHGIVST